MAYMPKETTAPQNLSSFASLNPADITHERLEPAASKQRLVWLVIACVIAVVAITVLAHWW